MKFGKLLRDYIEETVPDWKEKFLSYKQLKRTLKSLPQLAQDVLSDEGEHDTRDNQKQLDFIEVLNEEVNKFNDYFMDKEEDFVIRFKSLEDDAKAILKEDDSENCTSELMQLRAELVEYHGEIVLMLNWSMLNYTALVKLLKKHDKLTGNQLQKSFLANAMQQPFKSTKLMHSILEDVEITLKKINDFGDKSLNTEKHAQELPKVYVAADQQVEELDSGGEELSEVLKQTCVAIQAWNKIRKPHLEEEGDANRLTDKTKNLKDVKQTAVKQEAGSSPGTLADKVNKDLVGGKRDREDNNKAALTEDEQETGKKPKDS